MSTRRSRIEQRRGKALNDSELLRRARGRYGLLLNEDSELLPGAALALWEALRDRPRAACAGAQLLRPDGTPQACAWRFPGSGHRARRRAVPAPPADRPEPRRARPRGRLVPVGGAARQAQRRRRGRLPRSGLLRLLRRGRLRPAAARRGLVERVRAAGTGRSITSSSRPAAVPERRIVEMARNRDLYMRKHHTAAAARAVRWLTAFSYAVRALAYLVIPGRSPRRSLAPCDRQPAARAGRGPARGGRRVQPRRLAPPGRLFGSLKRRAGDPRRRPRRRRGGP